jgi:HNH endonuclease/AP2 domain
VEIQIGGKNGLGKTLLIDEEDVALLQGRPVYMLGNSEGKDCLYPIIKINGTRKLVHRIVAESMGLSGTIDHKNRNKCDARRQNLREASASQNGRNRGLDANNKSGLKGVSWCGIHGRWRAIIYVKGRQKALGYFTCKFEAARAYDRKALEVEPIHATTNLSLGLLPESQNVVPE